jgi:ubiquinone/menaquinone biosynthesis C-methylase UbiE
VIEKGYQSVLDVGCGTGVSHEGYYKDGYTGEYTGVDNCKEMVDIGKSQGINCVLADGDKLPFPDKSIDFVYCRHVLEHQDEGYEAILKEMLRVASKEVVAVFFMVPKDIEEDQFGYDANLNNEVPLNVYSMKKLKRFVSCRRLKSEWEYLGGPAGRYSEAILHIYKK